jgi:hypothetical protein
VSAISFHIDEILVRLTPHYIQEALRTILSLDYLVLFVFITIFYKDFKLNTTISI